VTFVNRQFIAYFVAALRIQIPDACHETYELTQALHLPETKDIVKILENDLDALSEPFIFTLDDYRVLKITSPVHDVIHQLLNYPSINMHFVIVTRRDPPLPLDEMRAAGQLFEIRMKDLQFNMDETALVLESILGFKAEPKMLSNLGRCLEGWSAGLRLALMAVRDYEDTEEYFGRLQAGILQSQKYLMKEVVDNLPRQLRIFLIKI